MSTSFDLTEFGFEKYYETSESCFWQMYLYDTLVPSKIVVLSSILSNGNWCYDIRIDSEAKEGVCDADSFTVANRYECKTKEQLHFLLTGSLRLSPFVSSQKHECRN